MSITYYVKNKNQPFFDSPFVKMARHFNSQAAVIGFPPIPINQDIPINSLYSKATEILELDSSDSSFVASRIRHLDFAARQSELADKITWKSSSYDVWEKLPVYDQFQGAKVTISNPALRVSVDKTIREVTGPVLNWGFNITGLDEQFTVTGSDFLTPINLTIPVGAKATVSLGSSQYYAYIENYMPANQTVTSEIYISWPYKGDLAPIKNRILQATDTISQLTDTRYDLLQHLQKYSMPEDVIAAFLIGLDSI